ncbi:hydrolase [Streptococcus bovimastitidis]|uniref:Hydrolase n=1 Tax=Streptococcus bovimastitidis TaxID=1856638 RepID=A0A1L8MMN2_9STRE|nr:HAD-IIB family hydrolase [Streptococcus bovimastitidis]OJF71986.1 hydrolase [Streptococcus bovimastitidis]
MPASTNIFVFDLDGTIVFNSRAIEQRVKEKLLALQSNATLIFASARPIRDMLPLLEDFQTCDLIGANGAMYRKNQQIQLTEYLNPNTIVTCFQLIEKEDLDYIVDYDWNYSAKISDLQHHILGKLDPGHLAKEVALTEKNVSKIILFNIEAEEAQLLESMPNTTVLYHQAEKELVITAKGINKYSALRFLIGQKPFVAFGNDQNDITMLNNATKGFVIGDLIASEKYQSIAVEDLVEKLDYWITK